MRDGAVSQAHAAHAMPPTGRPLVSVQELAGWDGRGLARAVGAHLARRGQLRGHRGRKCIELRSGGGVECLAES